MIMVEFLKPEEWNIDKIFENGKYNIPIYQRPYSWGKEEVSQLLKDILELFELYKQNIGSSQIPNEELLLFTGTLFLKFDFKKRTNGSYCVYDIVDGQQRITTITLMMMVLLNKFFIEDIEDDAVTEIKNYLWKKLDRKNNKEDRILTLGNIDKSVMIELFDSLYAKKDIVDYANKKIKMNINEIEKNLLSNVLIIDEYFKKNLIDIDDYFRYFDFIKTNVRFIAIIVNTNLIKLFSIFESINSKGKPLEEIDLFKSYIFQNIDETDYEEYLDKWGQLIIETNDNLMDYFTVYVRANISYYRNSIKLATFKNLTHNSFSEYFESDNIQTTMKRLIDDMLDNVIYYKMLTDVSKLEKCGVTKNTVSFIIMSNIVKYENNRALYFRLLSMKDKNNLSVHVIEKLVVYSFKFILTFQSIFARDSKQALNVFVDVQNIIYKYIDKYNDTRDLSSENFDKIISVFNKCIVNNYIKDDNLKNNIKAKATYKHKDIAKVILYLLECCSSNGKIDDLKLLLLLKSNKDITIDHILPQTPESDDDNYKYYISGNTVILKDDQDFIPNSSNQIISKDDFFNNYLDVIGNLRLCWSNDNIKKSNHLVELKEFDRTFNTGSQVLRRTDSIIKQILSSKILLNANDIKDIYNNDKSININKFDKIEYKEYFPTGFELIGETYHLQKYYYTQLLSDIINILYDLEKEKLIELATSNYAPMSSDRVYITNDKEVFQTRQIPFITLGNDIFVNKNLSAEYIIKFVYMLIKKFDLSNTDLVIYLQHK